MAVRQTERSQVSARQKKTPGKEHEMTLDERVANIENALQAILKALPTEAKVEPTKPQAQPKKAALKVRKVIAKPSTTVEIAAAKLQKGQVFCLRENGAQYKVLSKACVGSLTTLHTDHPKADTFSVDSARKVTVLSR